MARIASEAKAGYYPTPAHEMALICARLKVEPGACVSILDPCAGEGEALKMLGDVITRYGATAKTYAVELESSRAAKCKGIADFTLHCPYENARISAKSFALMWLNPPYTERNGQRVEVEFLRNLTEPGKSKLQNGGLLGFCIPQHVLKDAAALLAVRFDNIRVYRFTDTNFPVFKQVVVFGYQRAKGKFGPEVRQVREWLKALAGTDPKLIPALDVEDGVSFNVPASEREVTLFRGAVEDPREIAKDIDSAPEWDIEWLLLPKKSNVTLKPPVLPLKPTHTAVAIAAGAIGGNMGSHLLVGRTKKVIDRTVIPPEDEHDDEKVILTERHVTNIRVFTREGVFELE
ncbi:DUF6094 domain-containing protein [Desulfofundulus thermocisternus]|uniref:DUF6094 domain-containing protein n=1 Tax=Desulfofundulus thermocisternus TaxID=42471 RepID=UPI00217DC703|nr:DUF6094 domain-containing protein [Desulfofundulus thermocisternus]MCS5696959.1 DUF6094 domain-containing protein [Desulfofundulus thermocisternus]